MKIRNYRNHFEWIVEATGRHIVVGALKELPLNKPGAFGIAEQLYMITQLHDI